MIRDILGKMDQKNLIMATFSTLLLFKAVKVLKHIQRNKLIKEYFKNKVVLITGASAGLGVALAEQLYRLNCRVILCSRRENELNKIKETLKQVILLSDSQKNG
jgi:FlaA1/EpsC-like NDP-sugar epimerase